MLLDLLLHTQLGSVSTTTAGQGVVELIAFAALSWGTTLPIPFVTWMFIYG